MGVVIYLKELSYNFNEYLNLISNDNLTNLTVVHFNGLYTLINYLNSKGMSNLNYNIPEIQQILFAYQSYISKIHQKMNPNDRMIIISDYKFKSGIFKSELVNTDLDYSPFILLGKGSEFGSNSKYFMYSKQRTPIFNIYDVSASISALMNI